MSLSPDVARIRNAVRRGLESHTSVGDVVLVACSGGPDSMVLASATAFVAPRLGRSCGLVSVDHQLQDGSGARALGVVEWAAGVGFVPAEVATVSVAGRSVYGPEGAARLARYEALEAVASRYGSRSILLGHTRDDQAETVLLGLSRGSGPRGLSGMAERRGCLVRPMLDVSRDEVERAVVVEGLPVWRDPHNEDDRFTRSRLRRGMTSLVGLLGPKLVANLARTASLVRQDCDALDEIASEIVASVEGDGLPVNVVVGLSAAVRTRVVHQWMVAGGADDGELGSVHIGAVDALIMGWRGQGAVALPGGVSVRRVGGILLLSDTQV